MIVQLRAGNPKAHEPSPETKEHSVTNRWCRARFNVVYNTAYRDLQGLVDLGLIEPIESGRGTKYISKGIHHIIP